MLRPSNYSSVSICLFVCECDVVLGQYHTVERLAKQAAMPIRATT